MALTKEVTFEKVAVYGDGQMDIYETTHYLEDGEVKSGRRDTRRIDLDDDLTTEDQLVQDIAEGVFTVERKKDRKDQKDKEAEEEQPEEEAPEEEAPEEEAP